jgi:hypothetical protein
MIKVLAIGTARYFLGNIVLNFSLIEFAPDIKHYDAESWWSRGCGLMCSVPASGESD